MTFKTRQKLKEKHIEIRGVIFTMDKDVVEIKERLAKIEVLLNEKVTNLENRVVKLENNSAWIVRTIIGAVVVALLALVGL